MSEPAAAITEPQPILWHHGQAISVEAAAEQRAALVANPDYVKAVLGGDHEKSKELADLLMLSRGEQPSADAVPPPPQHVGDVRQQMLDKEAERELQLNATLRNQVAPESEIEIAQFERGEATKSQKDVAKRNIAHALKDQIFCAKVARGDFAALRAWNRWQWIAHSAREIAG